VEKRVVLINPSFPGLCIAFPPAFFVLAGYTPKEVPVVVIDENSEDINPSVFEDALIGITVMTATAPRAKELAQIARANGAYGVVFGGSHPTICPEEMKSHGTVVIGEIEGGSWVNCVRDYLNDSPLQPSYSTPRQPLVDMPLAPNLVYEYAARVPSAKTVQALETGRGCPFNCAYCSANQVCGSEIRHRPIDEVVREIRVRTFYEQQTMFVTDNNFGLRIRDTELLRFLEPQAPLRLAVQVLPQTADQDEFLKAFRAVGARCMLMGVETPSEHVLEDMRKTMNIGLNYHRLFAKLHRYEVDVIILLMLGFDSDTPETFPEIFAFIRDIDPAGVMFYILTPYPGTEVETRLEREGRILSKDQRLYDGRHLVFQPKLMTPEEFTQGYQWLHRTCEDYFSNKPSRLRLTVI